MKLQPANVPHLWGNTGDVLVCLDNIGVCQILSQHSLYELPHAVYLFTAALDCCLYNLHQQQRVSREERTDALQKQKSCGRAAWDLITPWQAEDRLQYAT